MSAAVNPTVIATGDEHTCVVLSDGTIKLWGQGQHGRLGNGSTSSNKVGDSSGETPDNLTAIGTSTFGAGRSVVSVGCGHMFTAVVLDNGEVWTTGQNSYGQLGRNGTTNQSTFDQVSIGSGIVATDVACGAGHVVILTSAGKIKSWGSNLYGETGPGSTTSPIVIQTNGDSYPWMDTTGHIDIAGGVGSYPGNNNHPGRTVKQIACGYYHSVALLDDGQIVAWGLGSDYVLGNGSTANLGRSGSDELANPYTAGNAASSPVIHIACGYKHSIACKANGEIIVWGLNDNGQLGLGNTTVQQTPTTVTSFPNSTTAIAVGATEYNCYVILSNYNIITAGMGNFGFIGNNTNQQSYGNDVGETWGTSSYVDLGTGRTIHSTNVKRATSVGGTTTSFLGVVLDNTGFLMWGANGDGQLGLGNSSNRGDGADEVENAVVSLGTGLYIRGYTTAGGGGDPYVTTIFGDTYKLPDGVNTFRMFETYCDENGNNEKRFIFNCLAQYPEKVSEDETKIISGKMKNNYIASYIKNNRLKVEPVKNMTFFRYGMLQYGEERVYIDLDNLLFFNSYKDMINSIGSISDGEFPDWIDMIGSSNRGWVRNSLMSGVNGLYKMEKCFPMKINIRTESHGEIGIEFYRYQNPQIRTGVQICGSVLKNIRGALVKRSRPRNIILKNLNDVKPIKNIGYKSNRYVNEFFMENGKAQKVKMKY